jgi:O-antigen/teichoic acid export membrane protein
LHVQNSMLLGICIKETIKVFPMHKNPMRVEPSTTNSSHATEDGSRDLRILAKGAGTTLIGRFFGRGISALTQIFTARLLGPAAYGLYSIGWMILRVVIELSTLGLQHGVIKFGSEYWKKDELKLKNILFQSVGYSIISSTIFGVLLFFSAPWIADNLFKKPELEIVIRVIGTAIPFMGALRVSAAGTRVSQDTRYSVMTEDIGRPAINLSLFVGFFLAGWGLLGALWSITLSAIIAVLWAVYSLRKLFPASFSLPIRTTERGSALIMFSVPTALTGFLYILGNQIDRFFVGIFLPNASVGIYQAMAQVSILFAMILGAFNAIFAPMIADFYHQGQMSRLERMYRITTKWALYLSIPVFLVILLQPSELMGILFGELYTEDTIPLIILSLGQLFNVATGSVGFLLIMTGRQNHWLLLSIMMVALSGVLSILLIPAYGLIGASLATTVSLLTVFSFGLIDIYRSIGLWPYDRRLGKGLLAGVAAGISGYLLAGYSFNSDIYKLFCCSLMVGTVFFFVLYLLGLDDEDKEVIAIVTRKIKGVRGD